MTLRNLRNIHSTRNSCRDTLPCVIWHLNYLSFLPLTEKPLIATLKFGILTNQFSESKQKSLFPESSKWQITSEKAKKEKIVIEAKFDSEFESNVCILCVYIYRPHFFYLNTIYIYNTSLCCNCRYVCLLLCLFISSFLNLIYFIILYIYYYYFAFNFYCSFITFLHFLY